MALHAAPRSPLVRQLVLYEPPDFGGPLPASVQAALPNSRIDILQGQEHVAMLIAPELFAQAVVSFLNQK